MAAYAINDSAVVMDDWGLRGYEYQGFRIDPAVRIGEDLGGPIAVGGCTGDSCASLPLNAETRRMLDGNDDVTDAALTGPYSSALAQRNPSPLLVASNGSGNRADTSTSRGPSL
jgi:hypothetical protein